MKEKRIFSKSSGIAYFFIVFLLAIFLFSGCLHDNEPEETPVFPEPAASKFPVPSVIRGDRQLSIGWAAKAGVEYEVWYGTDNNSANAVKWDGTIIELSPVAGTVITGLDNGETYFVWIRIWDNGELSDFITSTKGIPEPSPTAAYEGFVYISGGTVIGSNSYTMNVTVPTDPPGYTNAGKNISKKGVFVEGRITSLDSFLMAKHETTQALWYGVQSWAENNGYNFQNKISAPNSANKSKPVSNISWRDAVVWCNAYSEKSGLEPVYYYPSAGEENVLRDSRNANETACDNVIMVTGKNGFKLPTETEREYAARGGDPGKADWMFLYVGSDNADDVAWHHGNSAYQIQIVGQKNPNRLGIFDLSGNVQEWGWDWMNYNVAVIKDTPWYGESYSSRFNQKPMAGGGVRANITMSCVADRWGYSTNYRDAYVGFRLVRKVE
jgi:formylglycine-generating enzyme required for sulfatase activity